MYLKTAVKIPESEKGISEKKIKGTTYIYYEHGRKYYPDKKYTVPQCTSIGKLEEAKDEYQKLLEEQEEADKKKLIEAFRKSKRSLDEILEYMKGKADI